MHKHFTCEDCGGVSVDPGSLHVPELCPRCKGSGVDLVETDRPVLDHGARKPMERGWSQPFVIEEQDSIEKGNKGMIL